MILVPLHWRLSGTDSPTPKWLTRLSWMLFLELKEYRCKRINFLKCNQLDALISQFYFWNETLHVSDSSSVHHQEFFTVDAAMVHVIHVCWQLASRIRMERTNFSSLFLAWNSTCFGQFLCPSSGVFHCAHRNGTCHTCLLTACEQDQDGTH